MADLNNKIYHTTTKILIATLFGFGIHTATLADHHGKFHSRYLNSFDEKGTVKGKVMEAYLAQDALQMFCSTDKVDTGSDKFLKLIKEQQENVVYPSNGKYMGDWKAGEKAAQSGKGLTWKDDMKATNGGGCYNCHQMTKEEVSFGTIGPSLYNYGKIRGNSEAMQKLTYARIWNAKGYNVCSWMPRFGYYKILTEKQIKDIVALLLDPKSPVNK